jgi:hypothetical protein
LLLCPSCREQLISRSEYQPSSHKKVLKLALDLLYSSVNNIRRRA